MSRLLTAALCFLSVTAASAVELMDKDQKVIPPIAQLTAMTGDAKNGQVKYQSMCFTCHQIAGAGLSFGPDLTDVGTRRDKAITCQPACANSIAAAVPTRPLAPAMSTVPVMGLPQSSLYLEQRR